MPAKEWTTSAEKLWLQDRIRNEYLQLTDQARTEWCRKVVSDFIETFPKEKRALNGVLESDAEVDERWDMVPNRVKKWIKNHRKRLVYDLPSPGPHRQANGIRKAPLRTRAKCARDVILKCDGPSAAKFRELNKCHRERTITKNEKMAMWGTFITQRLQRPEVMALCQAKAQEYNSRTVKTVSPAPPSLIRDDLSSQTDLVEISTGVYSDDLSSPALPASSRDLRSPSPPVDLFGWSHNRGPALVDWEDDFLFSCSQVLSEIGFVFPPFEYELIMN